MHQRTLHSLPLNLWNNNGLYMLLQWTHPVYWNRNKLTDGGVCASPSPLLYTFGSIFTFPAQIFQTCAWSLRFWSHDLEDRSLVTEVQRDFCELHMMHEFEDPNSLMCTVSAYTRILQLKQVKVTHPRTWLRPLSGPPAMWILLIYSHCCRALSVHTKNMLIIYLFCSGVLEAKSRSLIKDDQDLWWMHLWWDYGGSISFCRQLLRSAHARKCKYKCKCQFKCKCATRTEAGYFHVTSGAFGGDGEVGNAYPFCFILSFSLVLGLSSTSCDGLP